MKAIELWGLGAGYLLGLFTGVTSFLRRARMFHPNGLLFEAEVSSPYLPPYAMARFSNAIWKNKEWLDVLGIAIRFSETKPSTVAAFETDQDLLFATVRSPFYTPIAPLFTNFRDFSRNDYYGVAPFNFQGQEGYLKIVPLFFSEGKEGRDAKLLKAIKEKKAEFKLCFRRNNKNDWKEVGLIRLRKSLYLDQEALRFDPFLNGQNIRPVGFVHYLRKGTYRLSQLARPKCDPLREKRLLQIQNQGSNIISYLREK